MPTKRDIGALGGKYGVQGAKYGKMGATFGKKGGRIDSYDPKTPFGKLRSFGQVKSIPVTESLLKKVNEKIKLKKPKPQIKKKKQKKKKPKNNSQKKLSDFWGKPKKKGD